MLLPLSPPAVFQIQTQGVRHFFTLLDHDHDHKPDHEYDYDHDHVHNQDRDHSHDHDHSTVKQKGCT